MNREKSIEKLLPLKGHFIAAVWDGKDCRACRCTSVRHAMEEDDPIGYRLDYYSENSVIIQDDRYNEHLFVEPVNIKWITKTLVEITEDEAVVRIHILEPIE